MFHCRSSFSFFPELEVYFNIFFFSFSPFLPIGRPFDQSMHVQFRVSEYHHFGRIVDARGDLPGLSALLAPRRPLPLLQSALVGHYIALARHPGIAPVRNSKLFLFTSFYGGTAGDSSAGGSRLVAIQLAITGPPPPPPVFYYPLVSHLIPAVFLFFI
jgi:hypothetical protein